MNKNDKIKQDVLSRACDATIQFDDLCNLMVFMGFVQELREITIFSQNQECSGLSIYSQMATENRRSIRSGRFATLF